MKVEDIKWYSPILLIVGTILSFADVITDILTLVEFYRADHKTWFGVGLAFVVWPCLATGLAHFFFMDTKQEHVFSKYSGTEKCLETFLYALHPFSAAYVRFKALLGMWLIHEYNKKVAPEDVDSVTNKDVDDVLEALDLLMTHMDALVLCESYFESFPQLIIQLYAISVQEEPVEVIQMISLSVSFLSIVWGFTAIDRFKYKDLVGDLKLKAKLALVLPNFFFMASSLLSICYFIVSYKWWIFSWFLFPLVLSAILGAIVYCVNRYIITLPLLKCSCLYMDRDEISEDSDLSDETVTQVWRMSMLIGHIALLLQNIIMILMYYFSKHSNTWYALPVTVCVCVFSVLWGITKIVVYHFLIKKRSDDARDPQVNA